MKQAMLLRFDTEAKMLAAFRKQASALVSRWVYSTEAIWSYEHPHRNAGGSTLPGPDGAFYACGYDAEERPVVLQEFAWENVHPVFGGGKFESRRVPTRHVSVEEFIVYGNDHFQVSRFLHGKLAAVLQLKFCDGLLVDEEAVRQGVYQHTRYEYERRRKRLQQCLSDTDRVFLEIAFGPHGEQTFFRVRRDGTRAEYGQRLPKGTTLRSLKETIRNRLLSLIPPLVASANITEPLYCVALAYDGEGNDPLPPAIGLGLDSERQRWKTEQGKQAWQWIWNPAEFHHYEKAHTQLEDDVLEEACDYLNARISEKGSVDPAAKILVEVAAKLNRSDWPTAIQRTPDFMVYAVDFELADLRKNFRAILPPDKLAALQQAGLLWSRSKSGGSAAP